MASRTSPLRTWSNIFDTTLTSYARIFRMEVLSRKTMTYDGRYYIPIKVPFVSRVSEDTREPLGQDCTGAIEVSDKPG